MEVEDKKKREKTYIKGINVEGVDQSGIVYKVSRFLADSNINIENLSSRRLISPETGTAIYSMEIKVQVPEDIPPKKLEEGLSLVGEELNVEISGPVIEVQLNASISIQYDHKINAGNNSRYFIYLLRLEHARITQL